MAPLSLAEQIINPALDRFAGAIACLITLPLLRGVKVMSLIREMT
jgi:hypothetical protein